MNISILALILSAATHAAEPQIEARWRPGTLSLALQSPPGEHIAPEAPAEGWIQIDNQMMRFEMDGAGLDSGLVFSSPVSHTYSIEGEIVTSLCEDDGSACRSLALAFHGEISGKRGKTPLAEGLVPQSTAEQKPATSDPQAAFAAAQASGRRVLLEFSTTWCPPCQLLGAEILHDPDDADLLAPFELVQLDADDPMSFEWKDRYNIKGYPTCVVTDGEGKVITRMLGYDGEAPYKAWLESAAAASTSIATLVSDLDAVPESELVQTTKRLIDEGLTDEARTLIPRIPDEGERSLLQFQLEPTIELLSIVIAEHQDRIMEWIWIVVYELFAEEDIPSETREQLRGAIRENLAKVKGEQAAELAFVLADITPEAEHPEQIFALGAAIYRETFKGDPELDRGRYTFLALLLSRAGDRESAIALMEEAASFFPEEFTYHYEHARLLHWEERHDQALQAAMAAHSHAYGDMTLRAAQLVAMILVSLERKEEAVQLLQETLASAERPREGLEVRTWRYREMLEEDLSELTTEPGK